MTRKMRKYVLAAVAIGLFGTSSVAAAESWIIRTDLWGNPAFATLTVDQQQRQVTGDLDGDRVTGEAVGNRITFNATDSDG